MQMSSWRAASGVAVSGREVKRYAGAGTLALLCALVASLPAPSQTLDALKGKPETVFRFFVLHDAVQSEAERLTGASRPADAQDLTRRGAETFGIDLADFSKLTPIAVGDPTKNNVP